jgi:hypothetical protein
MNPFMVSLNEIGVLLHDPSVPDVHCFQHKMMMM